MVTLIKLLIGAAVVVTAGVLVWNLAWMQEMGGKNDVNQLREEARQLEGERKDLRRNVMAEAERAVPVNKEEMVQDIPLVSEVESVEEPLQEDRAEVKTDVVARPEPVTEKKPEQTVQRDQNSDIAETVEETEIPDKNNNQFEPVPIEPDQNKPGVVTIKGKPGSNPQTPKVITIRGKTDSNTRTEVKRVDNSTPVTQHPTSTSPY